MTNQNITPEEFLVKNLNKVNSSTTINFQNEDSKQKFVEELLKKDPKTIYVSLIRKRSHNVFYISTDKMYETILSNCFDIISEDSYQNCKRVIVNVSNGVDKNIFDEQLRKRFKSKLPFAGKNTIFVDTIKKNYADKNGNEFLKIFDTKI